VILQGDCLEQLKKLDSNSVDSIVTDPPYGLSFMGKKWDYDVPSVEIWRECLRVLKPGGHLLAFGGTRTYHRLVVNIEDAGFEIRDQVMWLYGSGFPKSMDISKQIDKQAGVEREVVGTKRKSDIRGSTINGEWQGLHKPNKGLIDVQYTAPATEAAKQWQGWGTALKPANEPICVARKPIEKGLTVAENVIKWGTGALNIDASRIGFQNGETNPSIARYKSTAQQGNNGWNHINRGANFNNQTEASMNQGRWPANIILDEDAASELDAQVDTLYTEDGPSRFFYVAKASKRERGEGNNHPTVKPIKLMEYLIKLVTPPGGIVLDPFMGSGSTGVAAKKLNCKFIGCELNPEYVAIAEKRIG
jgi:DNA modification methylase